MISANGGLPAHRYTPQVTPRWPLGSEPASLLKSRVSGKPVGRVPWGRKIGFVMSWTRSVGKRSGARGAMSVSASNSGGRGS